MTRPEFFKNIEEKYIQNISIQKPFIIRFDGKNITSNKNINLLDETYLSFSDCLKKTSLYLSNKYKNVIIYCASDEINICVKNPKEFLNNFDKNRISEILSILNQEIFFYFYSLYKKPIFFIPKFLSLYEDNFYSYFIYRKHCNMNTLSIYFKKKYFPNINHIGLKYKDLNNILSVNSEKYNKRTIYQTEGLCYFNGNILEIEDILNTHNFFELSQKNYINNNYCEEIDDI